MYLRGMSYGFHPAVLAGLSLVVAGCQAASPQATPTPTATAISTPTLLPAAATATPQPPTPTATAISTPTLLSAAATATPQPPTPTSAPARPAGGDPARGQQLFASRCNACHPGGGQGLGPALVGVATRLSEAAIVQVVRQGRGEMPPMGAALTEQQMAVLLAYLRSLR